jgi:chemotaxis protein MotB
MRTAALVLALTVALPASAQEPPAKKHDESWMSAVYGELDSDYAFKLRKKLKKLYAADADQVEKIASLESQLDAATRSGDASSKTLAAKNAALERETAQLRARLGTAGADAEEMRKRLDELKRAQENAEKRVAQFREMVAKFKSMVDAGKLQVEIRNGLMLVKLPDNILFDAGKTALKPAGREAIVAVARVLATIEGRKFQVTGHTDNVPIRSARYKSNWELSAARAVEVLKVMVDAGLSAARLSAAGYADQLPVAGNDNAIGRLQNRRIEIVVMPNLEELPSIDVK